MTGDPLADVLRDVPGRPTVSGDYYLDMARAAREHIAAEVLAAADQAESEGDADAAAVGRGIAHRIARGSA